MIIADCFLPCDKSDSSWATVLYIHDRHPLLKDLVLGVPVKFLLQGQRLPHPTIVLDEMHLQQTHQIQKNWRFLPLRIRHMKWFTMAWPLPGRIPHCSWLPCALVRPPLNCVSYSILSRAGSLQPAAGLFIEWSHF